MKTMGHEKGAPSLSIVSSSIGREEGGAAGDREDWIP